MSYLSKNQAAKAFRSKGQKVYRSRTSALKNAKKIGGRTAVIEISGGQYIVKRV